MSNEDNMKKLCLSVEIEEENENRRTGCDSSDRDNYSMYIDDENISFEQIDSRKQVDYDLDSFIFPSSFVSFDFENLYAQRVTACSVGMVKYKNGKIVDKFYKLIRPPFEYEGKRGPVLSWIHGFTPDMFEGERAFPDLLPVIEAFIDGLPLVAHNACVERACICDACGYYHIETSIPYDDIIDTLILSKMVEKRLGMNARGAGSHSLNVVCQRFGVQELRHHHACDDAEMCGNLFLTFPRFLSGELEFNESAWRMASECTYWLGDTINKSYKSLTSRGHSTLSGDILQKDLTDADPNNPFYDRVVVITGVFNIERMKLAQILKSMGADINTSIGKKTNYILIGNDPGPMKLKKVDELLDAGNDVRKIYQEDLDLILAGKCFEKYYIEKPSTTKPRNNLTQERKTTWPNLVKKFKQYVDGKDIAFTERELQSEDYRLLTLYYKQQQKVSSSKETIVSNLRVLDEANECNFKKDILSCFIEGEKLSKEDAYKRMQNVFTKYGLFFKAKTCVLTELNVDFEEFKVKGIHHLMIKHIPQ